MNRKDTILVAVLINAGVLVVLFTSALKNKQSDLSIKNQDPIPFIAESHQEPISIMKDEIDLAIETAKLEKLIQESPPAQVPEIIFNTSDDLSTAAPANSDNQPDFLEVTVKKGDFLAKIAKRHQISVEELMKVNQLKNTNLRIGQVLKVPKSAAVIAQTPHQVVTAAQPSPSIKYYVVKAGDNPWVIAQKHKMKVEELLKLNQLSAEKAKQLKVGDKLKVKG
jgi:LysM repeat protein